MVSSGYDIELSVLEVSKIVKQWPSKEQSFILFKSKDKEVKNKNT